MRRQRRYSARISSLAAILACAAIPSLAGASTLTYTGADPHFTFDPSDGGAAAFFVSTYSSVGTGPTAINPSDLSANTVTFRFEAPAGKNFVITGDPLMSDLALAIDIGTTDAIFLGPVAVPAPVIAFENYVGPAATLDATYLRAETDGRFVLNTSQGLSGGIRFTAVTATFTFPGAFNLAAARNFEAALFATGRTDGHPATDPGVAWAALMDLPITQGPAVPLPAASTAGLVLLGASLVRRQRRSA